MLKRVRQTLAVLVFVPITLLFLDFTGTLHAWFSCLAEIQFIPAILAHNLILVGAVVALTLLFGRIYCSVICPLGVFQDLVARWGKRGKKMPYRYTKAKSILRYTVLALFVAMFVVGFSAIVSLLDPYAAYGRIANTLLQPIWILGNNALAYVAERVDSYQFYSVDVWVKSSAALGVAVATLAVLVALAWRNGRLYCNSICPVGTILGAVARLSIFGVKIDKTKCNKCGLCAAKCKSMCIDSDNYSIDKSRCVSCMNCIDICRKGAVSFGSSFSSDKSETTKPQTSMNFVENDSVARRGFIATALVLGATALKAQVLPKSVEMKVDGGLADIEERITNPRRKNPIAPPGAVAIKRLQKHCTACQLCVSACPNGVLKPSSKLENFMQPELSFNKGYCRSECVRCSEVCPSNAISPIDTAQKSATQIGYAVWHPRNCNAAKGTEPCDVCARRCPTKAITMADMGFSHPTPIIDTERCIGCGACEYLCSSRPVSAIYVEGYNRHRTI